MLPSGEPAPPGEILDHSGLDVGDGQPRRFGGQLQGVALEHGDHVFQPVEAEIGPGGQTAQGVQVCGQDPGPQMGRGQGENPGAAAQVQNPAVQLPRLGQDQQPP